MRHLTLICVLLFLFAGFFDYQTSHQVDQLDQKIAAVRVQTAKLRNDGKLLQTEWDQLDSASHLRPLADQFLKLQQDTPDQFVAQDQLGRKLPAAGAAPKTAVQLAMVQEAAQEAAQQAVQVAAAAKQAQAAEQLAAAEVAAAPVQVASVADDQGGDDAVKAVEPATKVAVVAKPVVAKVAVAAKQVQVAQAAVARPKLVHAPVASEQFAQAARPRPVLVAANLPMRTEPVRSASALGMAQDGSSLPAPVAVSDAAWRGE